MLKRVDERENMAELASKIRYTLYSKKVKNKALFDRQKEEQHIHEALHGKQRSKDSGLAERIQKLNEHFANKKW